VVAVAAFAEAFPSTAEALQVRHAWSVWWFSVNVTSILQVFGVFVTLSLSKAFLHFDSWNCWLFGIKLTGHPTQFTLAGKDRVG